MAIKLRNVVTYSLLFHTSVLMAAPANVVGSPDWRDQVIYFVLTDRFADGDPSNNDQGAGEFNPQLPSHYSGGDLVGIQSKLDYIQGLGASALWLTPPVANQWWSQKLQYAGYHGYWATDFKAVDAHYGTLASYQALAKALHQRQMYLIQDIVLNHTGNFFGYSGAYDAKDTAKNFVIYESADSQQPAPSQYPFSLINRHDPKAVAADIYHWTPPIVDASVAGQEYNYQLGGLADINTSNPQVRAAFKDSYRFWLEQVGVDAFRVDTAKYVEHDFWYDFLHSDDGVFAKARSLGKDNFLVFGEVFEASKPFSAEGEHKIKAFLGSKQRPELNSVIAFPLYFELNQVLAEGAPPGQLGYRLEQHTQLFANPHLLPTFLNNHDTKRFLASGSVEAFVQGYATIFTIPGIPVIYQGDEQLFTESRKAMFKGGFGSDQDHFTTTTPMYQTIARLAQLRREHPVFSRGVLKVLFAQNEGPGVLVYQMQYQGQTAIVVLNTADSPRMLANVAIGTGSWQPLWQYQTKLGQLMADDEGRITAELPARAVVVLAKTTEPAQGSKVKQTSSRLNWQITPPANQIFSKDFVLAGKVSVANTEVVLLRNGDYSANVHTQSDPDGNFQLPVAVRDLGANSLQLAVFAPAFVAASNAVSPAFTVQTQVQQAEFVATVQDAQGDDKGPTGRYIAPTQPHSQRQKDILAISAKAAGANLELEIKMAQVSQFWGPANGFDNVHFALFFDLPAGGLSASAQQLPGLASRMPNGQSWQLGHFLFGWGNSVFTAKAATSEQAPAKLGAAPTVRVDAKAGVIRIRYDGRALGVNSWRDASIYLSTWDKTGEGALRSIAEQASPWNFGGGAADSPKVFDDAFIRLHRP